MQKKILLLGGSYGQLPAIAEARKRGLYTILCDYLPDNPGRRLVDKYYEVSTTDKDAVLAIATEHSVDAILAYATDPAAITQAYVSEKMGLKGNTEKSVYALSNKGAFRTLQLANHFNTPAFKTFSGEQLSELDKIGLNFPVVVKPVDSSDTKGVYKVNRRSELKEKAEIALSFSRAKKVIVEEFIDGEGSVLQGDAFFVDGEMIFSLMGEYLCYSDVSPLKPSVTLFPARLPGHVVQQVENKVAEITKLSGFKDGPVNVEARVDSTGKIYIMEIGPRSGGSLIPQTIKCSCGFDMLQATFDILLNDPVEVHDFRRIPAICFTLHTNKAGVFREFNLNKELEPFVEDLQLYVKPGESVKPYSKPGSTIGGLILSYPDIREAGKQLDRLYQMVQESIVLS